MCKVHDTGALNLQEGGAGGERELHPCILQALSSYPGHILHSAVGCALSPLTSSPLVAHWYHVHTTAGDRLGNNGVLH